MRPDVPNDQASLLRRDAEPHRGLLLEWMGGGSVICGVIGICFFPLLLVSLTLGLAAYFLARSDLKKIQAGLMTSGRGQTQEAKRLAVAGILFSIVVVWLLSLIAVILLC
jgi:hypothetical protein